MMITHVRTWQNGDRGHYVFDVTGIGHGMPDLVAELTVQRDSDGQFVVYTILKTREGWRVLSIKEPVREYTPAIYIIREHVRKFLRYEEDIREENL